VQGRERRAADFVRAGELADQELAVAQHADAPGPEGLRLLQSTQQRPILGGIVRGHADRLRDLAYRDAVFEDDDSDRGQPGIASGGPVDTDREGHRTEDALRR